VGILPFIKKKVEGFSFVFYSLLRLTGLLFSNLEFCPGQFSTNRRGEKTGVENGHKLWFSTLFLSCRRGGEGVPTLALSGAPAPALPKGEPSRKVHH
jgi:hypothetical protein